MEWVEEIIRHFYSRHNETPEFPPMFKSPDSDSAIDVEYAIGASNNLERPKIQSLWTPYLELLLKGENENPSKVAQVMIISTAESKTNLSLGSVWSKLGTF